MAYCTGADITDLLGDIQLRSDTDVNSFAQKASDEVDSVIGFTYVTPIFDVATWPSGSAVDRVSKLLLQRVASFIGAARLIMSYDQQGEDNKPNAYAVYLLDQANTSLEMICEGRLALGGAAPLNPNVEIGSRVVGSNIDPYSQVEALYGWAAQPTHIHGGFLFEPDRPFGWQ